MARKAAVHSSSAGPVSLMSSHVKSWIWGRNVVVESLRSPRWRPLEVLLSTAVSDSSHQLTADLAHEVGIPCRVVTPAELERQLRTADHQGVGALMPAYPYESLMSVMRRSPQPRHWLVLDRVQDSFNFGAMIRSAVELQTEAILICRSGQSDVNRQVVHSSAGAVHHVPIVREESLVDALRTLRQAGLRSIAATEKGAVPLDQADLTGSTAIVIGNEGSGITPEVRALCDVEVCIPGTSRVGSLNAAVAAGIVCYERLRQSRSSRDRS